MNPLSNVLPPRVRQVAYAVVFVLSLIFAAWQAGSGDLLVAAGALLTSLTSALAASNVATSADPAPGQD